MNCRFVPLTANVRLMISSPSDDSTPASLSCGLSFSKSRPVKTTSTEHVSAPVRMSDLSARSPIYLETPECAIVVDTTPDLRTQALRENIRSVDAVIFTHSHTDHIMGFDDLRRFAYARGYMPVYASADTMRDLERVFEFAFKTPDPFPWYLKPEPHVIDGPFELGGTLITPLAVPHGDSIVNGYLFSRGGEKLVAYLSDCSAVPDEIAREILEVKALIIDALRDKPHPT